RAKGIVANKEACTKHKLWGSFAVIQVIVRLESPHHDGVARLIRELDAYQTSLYPAESNHLLDINSLADANVRFFVARRGSEAVRQWDVALCALTRIDSEK